MSAGQDRLHALRAARAEFWWTVAGSACLPAAIHLLSPAQFPSLIRLLLATVFFLSLATLTWTLTEPLKAYVFASWRLRMEDAGPAIETAAQGLMLDIARLTSTFGWLLTALVGVTGMRVLAAWPQLPALSALSLPLLVAWWGILAGLLGLLLTSTNRITEIVAQKRALERQMLARGFTLRTAEEAERRAQELERAPVEVTAPLAFRAGGFDWRWDDFKPNAVVFGQPGSGKTVTVLNALLDGLLTSASQPWVDLPAAGLILDPKGDYRDKIRGLMQRLGREGDLLILDPEAPTESIRWNPFDSPDDELELSERFGAVMAMLGQKAGDDSFFVDSAKLFMRHAIALLRATNPADEPPSFAGINELVSNPERLEARMFLAHGLLCTRLLGETGPGRLEKIEDLARSDTILKESLSRLVMGREAAELRLAFDGFYRRPDDEKSRVLNALRQFFRRYEAGIPAFREDVHALDACAYFTDGWLRLADRTQSGIQAQLTNMIDPFLMEPFRTMLSGRSTVSVAQALRQGRLLYVYMPAARRERMSRVLNTLVKLDFQREVRRLVDKKRPSLFLCDEFQAFFTDGEGIGDPDFFAVSRQSNHINLIATQNLNSLLRTTPQEETVHNLLGLCAVKFFLRNNDLATNKYASEVFGQYQEIVIGRSGSVAGAGGRQGMGLAAGISEQQQAGARLRPDEFTVLRIPDRGEGTPFSESWVRVGSRPAIVDVKLRFAVYPLLASSQMATG